MLLYVKDNIDLISFILSTNLVFVKSIRTMKLIITIVGIISKLLISQESTTINRTKITITGMLKILS